MRHLTQNPAAKQNICGFPPITPESASRSKTIQKSSFSALTGFA